MRTEKKGCEEKGELNEYISFGREGGEHRNIMKGSFGLGLQGGGDGG